MKSIIGLLLIHLVLSQNPSPCPQIFSYEPRSQEEDRWYGVVSLETKEDLDGVWLKIALDRPAEILGNWFGEATSSDNQEFTVTNSRYKLEAGPPVSVRFFIKYNAALTVPSVKSIKLNGKVICTTRREEIATTTPQLHLSRPGTTHRPNNKPVYNNDDSQERPNSSNNYGSSSQERNNNYGGTSQEKNNYGGTSYEKNNYGGSSSSRGSSTQERPLSNTDVGARPSTNQYNNNQQSANRQDHQSNTRRPPSSSSHQTTSRYNQRDRDYTTSGTQQSNGLSVDEDSARRRNSNNNNRDHNGFDFFPGDFASSAAGGSSSSTRPVSRPNTINKREAQCGVVAMKPAALISYGQNTTQGQWPWHAALYYAQGAQLMYTCGGTLISENHILTAAHCVAKPQTNRPIDTKKLAVYLGKYSLKKFGTGTQDREAARIFVHPKYNHSVYFNDIAVVKLKEPIDETNYVRPCCLWSDDVDIDRLLNKLGTVVGWGFDENREISDTLMQAEMPIVSTVNCIYSNREFFSQFTFEKNYCAGFRNGTTVCNGDSGGGMVFPKAGTSGHNTVWQIRGIVSVGVALQGQGVCDPSHYIVFTDVAKHVDWIKQVMRE